MLSDSSYLQTLSLSNNQLSGPIPSTLGSVSALCQVDLSSNNLNGTVPGNLDGLVQLQAINLGSNALSGADTLILKGNRKPHPHVGDDVSAAAPADLLSNMIIWLHQDLQILGPQPT